MSVRQFLADSQATEDLGATLAASLPPAAVVYLHGELGAGKSCLARSMLRALGVTGPVKSPTYTLIERYPLRDGDAVHLDLYRIAASAELEFLGLQDLAGEARLWLVEWPERGAGALPAADLEIALELAGESRWVQLKACSAVGRDWLNIADRMAPGASA